MSYLKFDKTQMTNLQESLYKELLLTNKSGAYALTTLVGCNIRKYHGLLVVPLPQIDNEAHVMLSSLDETVIQHGAEFNLGIHKYQGDNFSPKGHKYIYHFDWDKVPTWIYRVGGVLLKKEMLLQTGEDRLLVRYTLLESHSPTTLRLRPFLAFRSVREFTHKNWHANLNIDNAEQGIGMQLYSAYPELYMQLSHKNTFAAHPDWYMGFDYPKERERGYDSNEDLLSPGYFELPLHNGRPVIFTAALTPIKVRQLASIFDREVDELEEKTSFYQCLVRAARQFRIKKDNENYLIAGWPWFKCRARDMFVAMPGLTLAIGEPHRFELYMKTAEKAIDDFINSRPASVDIYEMEHPDIFLWAIWCLQQYAANSSAEQCREKYGSLIEKCMQFLLSGSHPNFFVHTNGLVWAEGANKAETWMNSTSNGKPVVPRTGYIVEINALWYNALKFYEETIRTRNTPASQAEADKISALADKVAASFRNTFVNKFGYLYDYVAGDGEAYLGVRPNMIFAVALAYSPLSKQQQKQVLDITTRELLTPKGIRSLSPKSSGYDPIYAGPQAQRDLAYHQGTAWPWLTGFYIEAYLKVYQRSGISFIERQLVGFEEELFYHCIGSLSELFDGNPPFHGRGAVSYAMNVGSILRAIRMVEKFSAR